MVLKKISLENYRNYTQQTIEFNENLNFFIGKNAQGKTNLLEAVYYLSTGRTFRNNKDQELINWKKDHFRISCDLYKENINREIQIDIFYDRKGNKQIKINGVKYRKISNLFGLFYVIIFNPDDLSIVKGGPGERRKYIDLEISQIVKGYYQILINYNKILHQRNNLLKEINSQEKTETLEIWNEQLVKYGSMIIKNRMEFLQKLVPLARKVQEEMTSSEEKLDIKYNSTIIDKPIFDLKQISEFFRKALKSCEKQEFLRKVTLVGPHRDDLIFYLNEKELRTFGSQGQQRTAVLALKLAQLKLYNNINGEYPLLLLDDVMSELDIQRREYLLKIINSNNVQTLITGANSDLSTDNSQKVQINKIENGIVKNFRR